MANTIRIKRRASGVGAGAPSGLANAELAYNEGDNILYYGFGTGGAGGTATQVIPIAGSGSYLAKTYNLSDLNNLQTARNNLASNTVTSGYFMRGDGTNVLMGSILASDIPTLNQNTTGNAGSVTSGVYTGRTLTAGSGLVGGGDLSADRTFNIGQGDGINVSADSISVNSTVVRTTGTQSINGLKSFYNNVECGGGNQTTLTIGENLGLGNSGVGVFDFNTPLAAQYWLGTQDIIHYAYGGGTLSSPRIAVREDSGNVGIGISTPSAKLHVNGSGIFASGLNIANQTASTIASFDGNKNVVSLSTGTYPSLTELSYVKGVTSAVQTQLNNKIAKTSSTTIGNIPTWSVTTGDALGTGYSVETTLTGGAGALPRADAVKTYVDNAITSGFSTNDAMVFKGTLGSGGTIASLPTGTVSAGWSYRVITTGTYAGVVSEVGDLIIAVADANGDVNSTWTVVQTNIDGAVVGPASATDNRFALFNGTTGKIIKDAGFAATTVGQNLVSLTNPGAIRFVRINADNTVSSLSDSDFRTAIGAGSSSTNGTVTSVAALTLATTGTDLSSSVANGTTTPTITLSVPTASASVRGALSSTDWSTFNNKAAANQTMFIGTTSVAINRSSAALVLTGITSIDGNAATVTNGVYTTGDQTIAGVKTLSNRPVLNSGLTVQASAAGSAGTYFPVFTADPGTSAQTLTTRTASNLKTDLSLNNVENTALSTWAGSTSITTLGTIATGTWSASTIAVNKGGTGQTSYINGELLIGNTSTSGLAKATLTQGSNVTITNGNGTITIAATDTNTATAADDILDGSNTGTQITYAPYASNQAASASPRFYNTADNPSGSGRLNVSAYFYATRLFDNGSRVVTASTICSDAADCTWDGGSF
jgi:hypothetical protein